VKKALGLVAVPVAIGGAVWAAVRNPSVLSRLLTPPRLPVGHRPEDFGLEAETVELVSAAGTKLHAWFVARPEPAPAVLVMHGWSGNSGFMLPIGKPLYDSGFHVMFLDGRSHGFSEYDPFTGMPKFAQDVESGLDWLKARPAVTSVALLGHSAGASAVLLAASRRPEVEAVVSVSAVADPRDMKWAILPKRWQQSYAEHMIRTAGFEDLDDHIPVNRVGAIAAPIMLIHGGRDMVVGVEHFENLAAARPDAETLLLPEAGHASLEGFAPAVTPVIGFLRRSLPPPA
jgi:pimeloyl-ACP methyl ester carboxylesterase